MNLLARSRVYLSGAVESTQNPHSWRVEIANKLNEMGMVVYDPTLKPDWFPNITGEQQRRWKKKLGSNLRDSSLELIKHDNNLVREFCLCLTGSADIFIVKLDTKIFTAGTFEELCLAKQAHKPIFLICEEKMPSMWLCAQLDLYEKRDLYIHKSIEGVVNTLKKIDAGMIDVKEDLRWLFRTYWVRE